MIFSPFLEAQILTFAGSAVMPDPQRCWAHCKHWIPPSSKKTHPKQWRKCMNSAASVFAPSTPLLATGCSPSLAGAEQVTAWWGLPVSEDFWGACAPTEVSSTWGALEQNLEPSGSTWESRWVSALLLRWGTVTLLRHELHTDRPNYRARCCCGPWQKAEG